MEYTFKNYIKSPIIENHLNMGGSNPAGERIDVTSLYLRKNGKAFIPVMGEYHFSRDSREHWYKELCKMKAGGITIVSTYLLWIYHEEEEGKFDFSGDNDIAFFIDCAGRAGLDVIIRIGPWAHGECRNGGFPDWLLDKNIKLRTNDPEYLKYARRFYAAIFEQIQPYQYKNGGNIVGIQFENELVSDAEHLAVLKSIALEIGFKAPIYTVTGWNSIYGAKIPVKEVLPVFAAYVEAPWAESTEELPLSWHFVFSEVRNDAAVGMDLIERKEDDGWRLPYERYPFATCELGAGLQPTHHRRVIVSGMDAYALSLVKLGSGNNLVGYYMYHGGNNQLGKYSTLNESRSTGYPNNYAIIDYDFHTALSSYGEAREQYGLLNMLHMFVNDFGEDLASMEYLPGKNAESIRPDDLVSLRYCMRRNDSGGFIFVNNYQRKARMNAHKNVVLKVEDIEFPAIDIDSGINFIFPIRLKMENIGLKLATAQLLTRDGNTFFFAAIPGISPEYHFEDGEIVKAGIGPEGFAKDDIRIVTLSFDEATFLRKIDNQIYYGEKCNIYKKNGEICAIEDGSFRYYKWEEDSFVQYQISAPAADAACELSDCEPAFELIYDEELQYGYPDSPVKPARKISWKKLKTTGHTGFIEIDEKCDVMQLYADGKLVADRLYIREPWRLPVRLLSGKECYLVMSEYRNDVFFDA